MAADFTVGPVSNGTGANQVIVFAETKPVFDLPPVEAGLYDFTRRPVRVVSDNNIFAERDGYTPGGFRA